MTFTAEGVLLQKGVLVTAGRGVLIAGGGMTVRMRNSPWGPGSLGGLGLGGEAAGSPPLLSTQKKHDFNPAQHSIFGCAYLVLNIKYHV